MIAIESLKAPELKKFGGFFILALLFFTFSGCDKLSGLNKYWWTKQAQEAHSNGDHKKAEELYKKVIELGPDDPGNYWDLAILYLDMNQNKKALEIHKKYKAMGADDYAKRLEKVIRSSQHNISRKLQDDERAIGF